jgi:hypothetical protein
MFLVYEKVHYCKFHSMAHDPCTRQNDENLFQSTVIFDEFSSDIAHM